MREDVNAASTGCEKNVKYKESINKKTISARSMALIVFA